MCSLFPLIYRPALVQSYPPNHATLNILRHQTKWPSPLLHTAYCSSIVLRNNYCGSGLEIFYFVDRIGGSRRAR